MKTLPTLRFPHKYHDVEIRSDICKWQSKSLVTLRKTQFKAYVKEKSHLYKSSET